MIQQLLYSGYGVFIICFILHFSTLLIMRHAFQKEVKATTTAIIAFSYGAISIVLIIFGGL